MSTETAVALKKSGLTITELPKAIVLSSANCKVEVESKKIIQSTTIANLISDIGKSDEVLEIVLPFSVEKENLMYIIKWCEYFENKKYVVGLDSDCTEQDSYIKKILDDKPIMSLIPVLQVANYLEISSLVDTLCYMVAKLMKNLSEEKLCETFGIETITPDEKKECEQWLKSVMAEIVFK